MHVSRRHPFIFYAVLCIGLTLAATLAVRWVFNTELAMAWLLSITPVTLLAYRYDKWIAGSAHRRVPERVLLLLALLGGTPGAVVGMWLLSARHKTSKTGFIVPFVAIVIFQAILVGAYFWIRLASS
jgi:uncharacterized membrane protein YsdA (DUF1294 family)